MATGTGAAAAAAATASAAAAATTSAAATASAATGATVTPRTAAASAASAAARPTRAAGPSAATTIAGLLSCCRIDIHLERVITDLPTEKDGEDEEPVLRLCLQVLRYEPAVLERRTLQLLEGRTRQRRQLVRLVAAAACATARGRPPKPLDATAVGEQPVPALWAPRRHELVILIIADRESQCKELHQPALLQL